MEIFKRIIVGCYYNKQMNESTLLFIVLNPKQIKLPLPATSQQVELSVLHVFGMSETLGCIKPDFRLDKHQKHENIF